MPDHLYFLAQMWNIGCCSQSGLRGPNVAFLVHYLYLYNITILINGHIIHFVVAWYYLGIDIERDELWGKCEYHFHQKLLYPTLQHSHKLYSNDCIHIATCSWTYWNTRKTCMLKIPLYQASHHLISISEILQWHQTTRNVYTVGSINIVSINHSHGVV